MACHCLLFLFLFYVFLFRERLVTVLLFYMSFAWKHYYHRNATINISVPMIRVDQDELSNLNPEVTAQIAATTPLVVPEHEDDVSRSVAHPSIIVPVSQILQISNAAVSTIECATPNL